jgi:hypothetical protein
MSSTVSYTSRQSLSKAFRIKLIDQRLPIQELRLLYQLDSDGLLLVVSQPEGVRQVFFSADELGEDVPGFLASKSWALVASRCQSSLAIQEVDPEVFFERAELALRDLHTKCVLSGDDLAAGLDMCSIYSQTLDVEAFKTYLILENLMDVAEQSQVYKVTDEELLFWKVVWKAVVGKSRALHQERMIA